MTARAISVRPWSRLGKNPPTDVVIAPTAEEAQAIAGALVADGHKVRRHERTVAVAGSKSTVYVLAVWAPGEWAPGA